MGSSIELGKAVHGGIAEAVPIGQSPGLQGFGAKSRSTVAGLSAALLLAQQSPVRHCCPSNTPLSQAPPGVVFGIGAELAQGTFNARHPAQSPVGAGLPAMVVNDDVY
jgi:hypothetical protein